MKQSRTISLGKHAYIGNRCINEIEITVSLRKNKVDKWVFSAEGCIWNATKTDFLLSGQCLDDINILLQGKHDTFNTVYRWWYLYHMNSNYSGTHLQEAFLSKNGLSNASYEARCAALENAYLITDKTYIVDGKPYRYGSAWLYREIPTKDLVNIHTFVNNETAL